MAALKTNRSVGLYITLTMVAAFLPAFLVGFVAARCYSEISSLSAFAFLGLFGDGPEKIVADILGSVVVFAILVWAACIAYGIYVIVLFWGICRDMNVICGKHNLGSSLNYIVVVLLSSVTLNIYYIYWSFQQGKRLKEAEGAYQAPVIGSGGFHMALALLASVPIWGIGVMVYKIRTDPLYFVRNPMVILAAAVLMALLWSLDVVNRAVFMKDVNALAGAYNMQQGGGYAPSPVMQQKEGRRLLQRAQEEGGGFSQGMGQPAPSIQEGYTMPVDEWMPDAKSAWKPKQGKAGYLQGRRGEYKDAVIPVEGELMIGRDGRECQVVVKRPDVSRKHCKISYNGEDGVYMVTNYSSNGVFNQDGDEFPQNIPVACSPGTTLVIAKSGNEFLLK